MTEQTTRLATIWRTLADLRGTLLLLTLLTVGCGPTSFLITPVPARQGLDERIVISESPWTLNRVALIDVDGVLINARPSSLIGPAGDNPVSVFTEKLKRAAEDDRVKAIVLRINSPGGTVTATDLMYNELQRVRQQTGKPVVACMLDVAASGGYYLACAADRIYAYPTTVTGSIGVIMILPELSGTMRKIGVDVNVIKSGELKDMGSLFREMDPTERAVFQKLVDGMYERFVGVVEKGRGNIGPDGVRQLADGRVYLGPEAAELGLVDEVGTLREAIAGAKQLAGLESKPVKVVRYVQPIAYRPNIYSRTASPPEQVNVIHVELPEWLTGPAPQLLYVWAPGW